MNTGLTGVFVLVRPEGFEPPAFGIGIHCDIQLRHGRILAAFKAYQFYYVFPVFASLIFRFSTMEQYSMFLNVFPLLNRPQPGKIKDILHEGVSVMSIEFLEEACIFFISTQNTSYSFRIFDAGYLTGQYWGRKMHPADLTRLWQSVPSGFSPEHAGARDNGYSLDLIPLEYPTYGGGDYRVPALSVCFPNGSRLADLTYRSHTIAPGTREPEGLPGLSDGGETLTITLEDAFSGLQVELIYAVYEDCDIIARHARIINATKKPLRVTRALSASVDLPAGDWECISLYGSHARERLVDRTPLHHGVQAVESRRGASSHHHNPFIALAAPSATEFAGEAYGAALVYSGNFLAQVEVAPFGDLRLQLGIHPADFSWTLEAGESFVTPQALLTYTDGGLNRLSQNFHNAIRRHLGHTPRRSQPRPIVINNWEGTYFDFNEEKLLAIIDSSADLGVDTFVLDDGWFGHRDDDTTSLGDWFVDRRKLPRGLTPLIERCEAHGMQFGLWFEPEMISEDSELYRAHPDWCIRQEGRPYCLGRHQLVLDLSRDDVLAHLKEVISAVLSENRISYVKWDMNRHMTDAYSAALPPERQPEIFHRYMLHLYELFAYLTEAFPQVLFEGCSGGGGRFDAGMLYYTPQIWTSDNSDAIERLKIQYGTSFVYPPVSMTAHVSACPNHQVGRTTPLHTRGLVAMSASFGYELNPLALTAEERKEIQAQTAKYRELEPLISAGDFYRLRSPFEGRDCSWMFVLPDKSRAFAVYVRQLTAYAYRPRLKLTGLDPNARYRIDELDAVYSGDELMYAGLALPVLGDFEAVSFTLTRV